jgi:hypothetical protein
MRPNTLGAYRPVPDFAYPGWRLRIPGGPAGGHYKGFTHNYSAGTSIVANDQFEADRAAGSASHDAIHASPRNPRGVYRGPAEVPPAPNAGTFAYRTYRGYQTERHPGTSISPGSFPAPFVETPEDSFISDHTWPQNLEQPGFPQHGMVAAPLSGEIVTPSPRVYDWGVPSQSARPAPTVAAKPSDFLPAHSVPKTLGEFPPYGITIGPGGQTTVSVGQSASSFAGWMEQQTILQGIANKWVIGGGILFLAWMRK